MKHKYVFTNADGKKSVINSSCELSTRIKENYQSSLGGYCTYTVEPFDNDIARAVVVEPSREYDSAQALIDALEDEVNLYKSAFTAAQAFIDSHVADPDITNEMRERFNEYIDAVDSLPGSVR